MRSKTPEHPAAEITFIRWIFCHIGIRGFSVDKAEFINRVSIAHRFVARGADGPKVLEGGCTTLAFGYVVSHFKRKRIDCCLAPFHIAFGVEIVSHIIVPDILAKRGWYSFLGHVLLVHSSTI